LQKELTRQGPESATSALFGNSRYQSLLTQLLVIDNQLASNSVLLLEKSPEMTILRQQRQNLLTLIRREGQQVAREMANSIQGLETRNQILTLTLDRLNRDVKKLSKILREYNDIQQELQIATDNLNQFLSKREALRIDAAQKEVPWQLLTPPGEPEATPVSLKRNLLLGAVLGLLLGVGTAILLDKLGDILHTSKQIKEVTQLPILGAIPYEKELRKLSLAETRSSLIQQVSLEQSNGHKERRYVVSPFCEAFRFLYTNIRFLSLDTPIRSLIVSSATVAEGKSTVAIYLAQAAAAMGQRVLLVDADLRYPSLGTYLNLTDDRGLTHLLSSSFSDFNSAIQRSPLEDNLFVLTAGLIASDPIKLLASQKMQDLMEELENAFDLVIYKAPSLMGFADTHLLSAQTNGVLLVAGLGTLKRSLLKQALDELRISGTSILGIVANSTKDMSHRKFPDGKLQRGLELMNLPQYASSLPLPAEKISR
jgi:capsular exopolysaccharide synthesis family protein